MKLMGLLDGILPVHSLSANLTPLLGREKRTYAPADHFMIIGNQSPHSCFPSIFDTRKLRPSLSYPQRLNLCGGVGPGSEQSGAGRTSFFALDTVTKAPGLGKYSK